MLQNLFEVYWDNVSGKLTLKFQGFALALCSVMTEAKHVFVLTCDRDVFSPNVNDRDKYLPSVHLVYTYFM